MAGKHKQNVSRIKPNQISLNDSLLATHAHKKRKTKNWNTDFSVTRCSLPLILIIKKKKQNITVCFVLQMCITSCCSAGLESSSLQILSRLIWSSAHPPPQSQQPPRPHPGRAASWHSYCWLLKTRTHLNITSQLATETKLKVLLNFPQWTCQKKKKKKENVGYAYKSYKAISKQHNRINDEILNRLFRRPTPDFSNDYSEMFY